ncbi:MAG: hypothetical protein AB7P18_24540 [Candidatus Binatia bacterium]
MSRDRMVALRMPYVSRKMSECWHACPKQQPVMQGFFIDYGYALLPRYLLRLFLVGSSH